MNLELEYPGTVVKGRFIPLDPTGFKLAFPPYEGKEIAVRIYKRKKRRSDAQNKYYFGVVIPLIGEAIGERDKEAVHDMLKSEFNFDIKHIGERDIKVPQSTAKLNTEQFKTYIEQIQEWAAEWLNVVIPDPENEMGGI